MFDCCCDCGAWTVQRRGVDEVVECLLAGLVRERRSTAFIAARVSAAIARLG
ncbi:MAG TPA: hypothetical protein VHU88_05085 [Sporichthyaceae bacterium]|nr:hypothetical protein [Sporichthyaceae bacterium]